MADICTTASAKRRCGTVSSRLTWIERDIVKLKEKEELAPSDQRKIKHLKELAKEQSREFEQRHVEVLNFIEA